MQTNEKQTATVNRGIISFTPESNRVKLSQSATHALGLGVISASLGRLFMGLKQPRLEPAAERRLDPTLPPQPLETCSYLRPQQQTEVVMMNKYTNDSK